MSVAMNADDRRSFRENLQAAQRCVWSARAYALDGDVDAATNCLRIGGTHRRIARGFCLSRMWLRMEVSDGA